MIVERKPRIGLLLIGSPRFKPLGEGTAHGTYEARKLREEKEIIGEFQEIGEIVTPGIVYEREDVTKAIDLFFTRKVDCVAAAYLPGRRISPGSAFCGICRRCPVFYQHHPGPGRDHRHQRRG